MSKESVEAEIMRKHHTFNPIDYPIGTRVLYELKVEEDSPIYDCVIEATVQEWSPSFKAVRLANTGWHKTSSILIVDKFSANKTRSLVPSETIWDGIYEAIKYAFPVSIRPQGIYFVAKCMHGGKYFVCGKVSGNEEPVFECTYDPKTKTAYGFNIVKIDENISTKTGNKFDNMIEKLYGKDNFEIYDMESINKDEIKFYCKIIKSSISKLQEPESFTCIYNKKSSTLYDLQCKYKY